MLRYSIFTKSFSQFINLNAMCECVVYFVLVEVKCCETQERFELFFRDFLKELLEKVLVGFRHSTVLRVMVEDEVAERCFKYSLFEVATDYLLQ